MSDIVRILDDVLEADGGRIGHTGAPVTRNTPHASPYSSATPSRTLMDELTSRINDTHEAMRLTALNYTVITADDVRTMRGCDG